MEKDDVGGQKHRQTKTEVDEDEDRCTLGLSKVAAPFQLMTPQSNTDRGRWRRHTHTGVEWSGSSLTAEDAPKWRRQNLILHFPCDWLTPKPMKDAAVSATPGPVIEPSQLPRSWTYFQENEWLRNVNSPLRLCQLVWQKTNCKNFQQYSLN